MVVVVKLNKEHSINDVTNAIRLFIVSEEMRNKILESNEIQVVIDDTQFTAVKVDTKDISYNIFSNTLNISKYANVRLNDVLRVITLLHTLYDDTLINYKFDVLRKKLHKLKIFACKDGNYPIVVVYKEFSYVR